MSQVFDALQRSESERSGTRGEAMLPAIELLRRFERQATARNNTEPSVAESSGLLQPGTRLSSSSVEDSAGAPAPDLFTGGGPDHDAAPASVLSTLESLTLSASSDSKLPGLADLDSPAAEAFRLLAVRLRHLRRERPLKKVLITSTLPEEGKSFTAVNLARALALNSQQRTLLVEADVRRPVLWRIFGTARIPGLCEHLRDGRSLSSSVYRLDAAGFWMLPAGSADGDPLDVIQSPKLPATMEQLAQWFDWIIIDSPPALPFADTTVMARLVDGILLVARRGTTRKRKLQRGLETLEPNKLIGAVLNSSNGESDSDYYYSYREPSVSQESKVA